jgi:hypothetical protein
MSRWSLSVIVAATAVKLWLIGARTLEAIGWAGHDDRWFLQRALSILHGHWLGPYNHMTLIKGQGYPLWVGFISSTHVPLLFAQQFLYALACFAVSRALAPALRSSVADVILFVVLLFNPMSVSDDTSIRVTREGLYPALGLLVFAGAAGTVLRLNARPRHVLAWAVMCGAVLALFWHTREEGVWFVPLLAVALLVVARWVLRDPKGCWRRAVLVVGLPVLIVSAAHFALVLANGLTYGVFDVVEFKWRPFLGAYGSLTYVRAHPPVPRVPVPKEMRERVYAVSPAFAELRPFLEGKLGSDWRRGSGDLGAEAFMWAFREATEKAGYYARGSAAVRAYYERITRQIAAARLDGRLDARPPRASLLPPLLWGQRRATFRTWLRGLARIPTFEDCHITPGHSDGYDDELREFAETTRTRLAPRKNDAEAQQLGSIDAFRLRVLQRINQIYQRLFAPLFAVAVLLYLFCVKWLMQRQGEGTIAILMAGLLATIAARVLILALIDVTSFDVFTGGYQSPEYPLLLIVGVVAGHGGIVALRSRRHPATATSP